MDNKKLIKQYLNTAANLTPHQLKSLTKNESQSYYRRRFLEAKQDSRYIFNRYEIEHAPTDLKPSIIHYMLMKGYMSQLAYIRILSDEQAIEVSVENFRDSDVLRQIKKDKPHLLDKIIEKGIESATKNNKPFNSSVLRYLSDSQIFKLGKARVHDIDLFIGISANHPEIFEKIANTLTPEDVAGCEPSYIAYLPDELSLVVAKENIKSQKAFRLISELKPNLLGELVEHVATTKNDVYKHRMVIDYYLEKFTLKQMKSFAKLNLNTEDSIDVFIDTAYVPFVWEDKMDDPRVAPYITKLMIRWNKKIGCGQLLDLKKVSEKDVINYLNACIDNDTYHYFNACIFNLLEIETVNKWVNKVISVIQDKSNEYEWVHHISVAVGSVPSAAIDKIASHIIPLGFKIDSEIFSEMSKERQKMFVKLQLNKGDRLDMDVFSSMEIEEQKNYLLALKKMGKPYQMYLSVIPMNQLGEVNRFLSNQKTS